MKPRVIQEWTQTSKQAYAEHSQINTNIDRMAIEADSEAEAMQFFDDNRGWGRSGKCPPYIVRHHWADGKLISESHFVGYD
jgi:hypothetical protein